MLDDHLRAADRQAMYQTIFVLLRDTGRRPEEIVALPRDCLEVIRGEVSLICGQLGYVRLG